MSKLVMDHIVYLVSGEHELENLLNNSKTNLIRGLEGIKIPYGRVNVGDVLYFINDNDSSRVKAAGVVKSVFYSEKLSKKESEKIVEKRKTKLKLTAKQLKKVAGKKYLVLVEVEKVKPVKEFEINSDYITQDDEDWFPVGDIRLIKNLSIN
jgi:hypothetical protein